MQEGQSIFQNEMDGLMRCRADMSCHWEDTDVAVQEIFSNVSRALWYYGAC